MVTDYADTITVTSGNVVGHVGNWGGALVRVRFVWGDTVSYGSSCAWSGYSYSTGSYLTCSASGLTRGKTYHFRIEGQNSAGTGYGGDLVFTTKPDAPSSFSATAVSTSQINLSWSKGSGAYNTMVRRSTGGYPTSPSAGTYVYYGTGTSYSDTGLSAGTTYYYSIWSDAYEEGYYQYSDGYVTNYASTPTPVYAPTMVTDYADTVTVTSGNVVGHVGDWGGALVRVRFVWGDTVSYGSSCAWSGYSYSTGSYLTCSASGLTGGKTYHFRIEGQNSAGTGYGSDTVFTTKPDIPSSFTATAVSSSQINLSWSKGSGAYYTMVRRKTGSYPTSVSDGTQVYYNTGTSFSDTGLTGGTTYYYSVWSQAYSEEYYYQYSDSYVTGYATTLYYAPTVVTDAASSIAGTTSTLNGYVSSDGGAGCNVRFVWGDTASYGSASGWTTGYTYYSGNYFTLGISSLTKGKTYHFQAQAQHSGDATIYAGLDAVFTTKPDIPSSFTATAASSTQINLSWSKGSGAYYTMVRRKTGSYPTSPSDGTQVYYDTGTSYSDTGLTAGTIYYYSAWSRAYEETYYQYSDTYAATSETATTPMRDCDIACVNQGYPGGYCAARDWARENCVLGGYSSEVVDIGFQGKCVVPPVLIGSCQCCQSMINTQITGFGFDPSSITLGQQTAVSGYLKTTGGTGINGENLTLMYYGVDSLWHSTGQSGTTSSGGYVGFYWTPSSFYQGTVSYRLEFAAHGNYNPSQSASTNLTVTATCTAPGLPASPCSQQSAHAINFSWNAVTNATNYRVEWCNASYNFGDANCCTGACYAVTSTTSYYVYGLNTGTSYKFRVRVDSATGCAIPGAWSSNQQCATLSQDVVDCNNECSRRGYANPGDCYPLIGGYIPCGGSQTNYGDPIGKYGACSGLFVGGCVCCHNCPNPPVSDYVSVGSCSTAITGKGWDATDGVIFGYRHLDKDTTWRKFSMDDNPGDSTCGDNLELKNSWSVSGNTITVQTDVLGKSATHSLGGGFDFNPGGCKYTVSKIGVAGNGNETYTSANACMAGTNSLGITGGADTGEYVRWLIDMEYCGDGQCNCGETCTSCSGDCGICDTTPPTSEITGVTPVTWNTSKLPVWLRKNTDGTTRTYTLSVSNSDNTGGSGLDKCELWIYDNSRGYWTIKNITNCGSSVSFTVGSGADCQTQLDNQCTLWVRSWDKRGNYSSGRVAPPDEDDYYNNGTSWNYIDVGIDWTSPEIQ